MQPGASNRHLYNHGNYQVKFSKPGIVTQSSKEKKPSSVERRMTGFCDLACLRSMHMYTQNIRVPESFRTQRPSPICIFHGKSPTIWRWFARSPAGCTILAIQCLHHLHGSGLFAFTQVFDIRGPEYLRSPRSWRLCTVVPGTAPVQFCCVLHACNDYRNGFPRNLISHVSQCKDCGWAPQWKINITVSCIHLVAMSGNVV
jgi:hypothetical protein